MDETPDQYDASFLESLSDPDSFRVLDSELDESSQPVDLPEDCLFNGPARNHVDRSIEIPFRRLQPEPNHKVAIPRASTTRSRSNRARVLQACKSCQELKTKCSGHRPICHRCEELGLDCNYGERKREITAKKIEDLSSQVHILGSLLCEIYPRLDTESAKRVSQSLNKPPLARSTITDLFNAPNSPFSVPDSTQEDFNREPGIQAIGFIGEHSAMAWLHRLKSILEQDPITSSSPLGHFNAPSFSSVDYYENGYEIDVREDLDVFERPKQAEVDELIDIYFQVIHPSFPIIGKATFLAQYRSLYSNPTARPGRQWLAVLNFIFAIATTHFSPKRETTVCDRQIRRAYFSRGWILSIDKTSLREHANLQQVQAEGLASFYLLSVGQVNRSWKSCGTAIRSALAMGLHLRNESQIPLASKEIRYRVWWALYMLDTSLSELTGRPPSVERGFCTTPLPIPFEEESLYTGPFRKYVQDVASEFTEDESSYRQSSRKRALDEGEKNAILIPEYPPPSNSLCFWFAMSLSMIKREVIESLYAPSAPQKQWGILELAISSLNTKVDTWIASLPASYNFQTAGKPISSNRHSANLAFQYYCTKILITQPCLRQLMHSSEAPKSPELSYDSTPGICIHAAIQMIELLPNQPNLTWLYGLFPWWSALQYIVQAITIMLTGSFLRSKFGSLCHVGIPQRVRKAQEWLKELCKVHVSARKAWLMFSDIISSHGARLGFPDS